MSEKDKINVTAMFFVLLFVTSVPENINIQQRRSVLRQKVQTRPLYPCVVCSSLAGSLVVGQKYNINVIQCFTTAFFVPYDS